MSGRSWRRLGIRLGGWVYEVLWWSWEIATDGGVRGKFEFGVVTPEEYKHLVVRLIKELGGLGDTVRPPQDGGPVGVEGLS